MIIDNGILQLTLSKPGGIVTGVKYNGVDNLMEILNNESNRGFVCLCIDYNFSQVLSSEYVDFVMQVLGYCLECPSRFRDF